MLISRVLTNYQEDDNKDIYMYNIYINIQYIYIN